MPAGERRFQYALLRVVPRVDRGEQLNAGVVLLCRQAGFLAARVALDEDLLTALAPGVDVAAVRAHLEALVRVAEGRADAGPVARLTPSERFGWLVAPTSTAVQPSPVHTGLCTEPARELDRLLATLVAPR